VETFSSGAKMPDPIAAWDVGRYCDANGRRPNLPDRTPTMSDTPPDRLSSDPKSPYYDEALLERGVGIRFKGVERTNVEEYCISEQWVRLSVGNTMARNGRPVTLKLKGEVEAYFRDTASPPSPETPN
jgi:hypothetical protein